MSPCSWETTTEIVFRFFNIIIDGSNLNLNDWNNFLLLLDKWLDKPVYYMYLWHDHWLGLFLQDHCQCSIELQLDLKLGKTDFLCDLNWKQHLLGHSSAVWQQLHHAIWRWLIIWLWWINPYFLPSCTKDYRKIAKLI